MCGEGGQIEGHFYDIPWVGYGGMGLEDWREGGREGGREVLVCVSICKNV